MAYFIICCNKCLVEKSNSQFFKDAQNKKHGHRLVCKTCCSKIAKEYRKRVGLCKNRKYAHEKDGKLICLKCGEYKDYNLFGNDAHHRTGKRSYCKECDKKIKQLKDSKKKCITEGCNRFIVIDKRCKCCFNRDYNKNHRRDRGR